ncbi:MAG: MBOAT family protein, partial [Massilibacteroides sp.]|nr:MBOAT family protein [Massilibacteroides sp.]
MLLIVTALTYFSAHYIANQDDDDKRSLGLRIGIIGTLLPLLFFKYFTFLANTLVTSLHLFGLEIHPITTNFVLPIGISFYTFMAIGYLVDVFNEEVDVEPNYISVSLFLSFFPYILSGPIERAGNMFGQFKNLKRSTWHGVVAGLKLMLWGYFMKLCIADRLALYNDLIFNSISSRSGSTLAIASLLYPIQVYADLGGYTLIVMGISQCLGIKIIPNFNRPFL